MTHSLGILVPPSLPARDFVRYVRAAETHGFAELWVVEDCFFKGGVAQAAIALASTSRITVGIGILPAASRNVAFASMEIATLASIFGERMIVGVGHGMPTWMRQTGTWPASPLTLLDEYLGAMRRILAGDTVTVAGRYVSLDAVALHEPPTIVPPLYTGVRGPKSLALSGRIADGTILAEPVTPEYLTAVRSSIGVPRSEHRIAAYNIAAVDASADRARDLARGGLAWIGEPDWAPHISPLPFAEEFAALRASAGSREEFAARLPDAWVDQLAVVGTPAAARARLDELHEAGVDHHVLIPAGPDPFAMMESLARLV